MGCDVHVAAPSAPKQPIDSIGPVEDGTYRQYSERHAENQQDQHDDQHDEQCSASDVD